MRILMLSPTLGDAFGQERVLRDSTLLLAQAGHEIYHLGEKICGKLPECSGIFAVPELTSGNPAAVGRAKRFLDEVKPDLIHWIDQFEPNFMHWMNRNYPAVLTAHTVSPTCPASHRMTQNHQVCSEQSGWKCLWNNKRFHCLSGFRTDLHRTHVIHNFRKKRRALKELHAVVAISKYVQDTLIRDGFPKEKVHLIYNPVEKPAGLVPMDSAPKKLLVSACRLVELKGLAIALHALHKIQDLEWTYWICGEGPLETSLRHLVVKLGLQSRVEFKGRTTRETMLRIFADSYTVLQPNLGPEGFGLSAAEAGSLGIPVIASDIPALNEIVVDQETGYLFAAGNASELAVKLQRLLSDEREHRRLAENASRSIQERYSPKQHLEKTLQVYDLVLGRTKLKRINHALNLF